MGQQRRDLHRTPLGAQNGTRRHATPTAFFVVFHAFLGKAGKDAKTLVRRTGFRTKLERFLVCNDTLLKYYFDTLDIGWLICSYGSTRYTVLIRPKLAFVEKLIELQVQSVTVDTSPVAQS